MDQFLDRGTINGNDLIPSVDQRIGRHRGWQRPLVARDLEPGDRLIGQSEDSADLLRLRLVESHLTKASGRRPLLALADRRSDTGPAYVLLDLGRADHARHFTAIGNHRKTPWIEDPPKKAGCCGDRTREEL